MTPHPITGEAVESELRRVSRSVRRAMLAAVPDGQPHRWLYQLVRSYPSRPGKALRPTLCIQSCRAFGGTEEDAFPVAVAIEMLHNAFLVHDDIADGSELRRGRPTLPADYGQALSLNAGDALVVLANQVLRRHARTLDDDVADRVLDEFDNMALRTLEGQATELGWRRERVIDDRERRQPPQGLERLERGGITAAFVAQHPSARPITKPEASWSACGTAFRSWLAAQTA